MSILKYNLDKDVFIEASAGTGKTFSIEHIVLRLLIEKNIKLKEIVLLTFTNKAANDLKTRIIGKISNLIERYESNEPIDFKKDFFCNITALTIDKLSFLKEQILKQDESMIGTIHSFCQKLILKYPDVSKTATKFNFQSKTEFARKYESEVLKYSVLNKFKSEDVVPNLDKVFKNNMQYIYDIALPEMNINYEQEARKIYNSIYSQFKNDLLEDYRDILLDHIHGRSKNKFTNVLNTLNILVNSEDFNLNSFIRSPPYNSNLDEIVNSIFYNEYPSRLYNNATNQDYEIREVIIKLIKDINQIKKCYLKNNLLKNIPLIEISKSINQTMIEAGNLQLDHLITLVYDFKDEFHSKFKMEYKYLIVDEFQDTDHKQWEIFSSLARDTVRLIVVGDPKQSIYKFRGADIENYTKARESKERKWIINKLDTNFRSTKILGNFFNNVFSKNWFNLDTSANFQLSDIEYNEIKFDKKKDGALGFLEFKDNKKFFEFTAKIIIEKDFLNNGTVAILSRSNYELKRAGEILTGFGIPWRFKAINWSVSREVLETTYLIDGLIDIDKSHKICLTRFWKTEPEQTNLLINEKDKIREEHWFNNLKYKSINKDWSDFFFILCNESYLLERLKNESDSERVLYDYLEIWDIMESIAIERNFSLIELRNWIEEEQYNLELSSSSTDEENSNEAVNKREGKSVELITIHSSKGLEFDTVFIPPSKEKSKLNGDWALTHFSYKNDKSPPLSLCNLKDPDVKQQALYEENLEFRRLYYVALTRAISNLYIGITYSDNNNGRSYPFPNNFYNQYIQTLEFKLDKTENKFKTLLGNNYEYYNETVNFNKDKYKYINNDKESIELKFKTPEVQSFRKRGFVKKSFTSLSKTGIEIDSFDEEIVVKSVNPMDISSLIEDEIEIIKEEEKVILFPNLDSIRGKKFGTVVHSLFEELDFAEILRYESIDEFKDNSNEYSNLIFHLKKLSDYRNSENPEEIEKDIFQLFKSNLELTLDPINIKLGNIAKEQRLHEENFFLGMSEKINQIESLQKGFLNGSIDLLFEYDKKYYILDWKTNYLGSTEITIKDTIKEKMGTKNDSHTYTFQGYIYMLALYNLLKSRGIENPIEKMGGAFFLFVRHREVFFISPPTEDEILNLSKNINDKLLNLGEGNDRE
jgi:exodeoxyribonuclease V beta subunit